MRLKRWFSAAFAAKTNARADVTDGLERNGVASAHGTQGPPGNAAPGTAVKTAAEQRAAMLQAVARKKNNVPPQIKVRGFDRTRVSQMPIKRYNRAR
jgi:hypothetical protein